MGGDEARKTHSHHSLWSSGGKTAKNIATIYSGNHAVDFQEVFEVLQNNVSPHMTEWGSETLLFESENTQERGQKVLILKTDFSYMSHTHRRLDSIWGQTAYLISSA